MRSTTQDRMLKSAENWLAGFFGLEWPKNATLELLIEADGFNNSLAGERACKNANTGVATGGTNASAIWQKHYLADAVKRLQASTISGFTWNISDAYKYVAFSLIPETHANVIIQCPITLFFRDCRFGLF